MNKRLGATEIYKQILFSIENKKPYSAIRFNDGEAIMLGYPQYINDKTIKQVWCNHFGTNEFTIDKIEKLKKILIDSCYKSDVIGLPLKQNENNYFYGLPKKHLISDYNLLQNAKAANASFHRELHELNLYKDIFNKVDKVYCVTGRDCKKTIEKHFNVECNVVKITPQIAFSNQKHNNHPEIYDDIVEQIKVNSKNNLWLIGAGFYAKGYCKTIKENGGIAIDIGSMFDAWLGIKSRGFINEKYKIK